MTENEACIFLGMEKGEDPFEAFEESLFQFKKFFTSQPIIRATFLAKLKKVEKVEEAALFFGIETPEVPFVFVFEWSEAKELLFVFQSFQAIKSKLFLAIQDSKSCAYLKLVIHTLLDLNLRYIDKIAIQDNFVYYIYRPFESTQKKFLYKERLPYEFGKAKVPYGKETSIDTGK